MSHQGLIDDALAKAKARLTAGVERTDKVASAPGSDLQKEASEVANALEYMALAVADDGSAAGAARKEMVSSFFKEAAARGPKSGPTTTTGTQGTAPDGGKKRINSPGAPKGNMPPASESPTGKMPENILRTMPPGVKSVPKDDGGKTANMSLYDILMTNKEAGEKEAANGGPREMDAEQALTGVPQGGDGQAHAHRLLNSNSAPVEANKREAKAPTRPRLAEVWANANDTVGDATAKAIWPGAASKGDMKVAEASVAELARFFSRETQAEKAASAPAEETKEASLADYSSVFVAALNGELGKEAQAYAEQVEAL